MHRNGISSVFRVLRGNLEVVKDGQLSSKKQRMAGSSAGNSACETSKRVTAGNLQVRHYGKPTQRVPSSHRARASYLHISRPSEVFFSAACCEDLKTGVLDHYKLD